MRLAFIYQLASLTIAGYAPLSFAELVPAPDAPSFRLSLRDSAIDEAPCAAATVRADEVILPATWCLALADPEIDTEHYIDQHEDRLSWTAVLQPREINALLVESKLIPDPRKSRNLEDLAWLAEAEWWLANEFYWPEGRSTEGQSLVLEGLIAATGAWLNGQEIKPVQSEFTQWRADLRNLLSPKERNRLVLRITASAGQKISPRSASPAAFFRCGVQGTARIVREPDVSIEAMGSRVNLATDCKSGTVELDIRVRKRSPGAVTVYTYAILRLPDEPRRLPLYHSWGEPESLIQGLNRFKLILKEENIRLWWPLGAGERHIYPLRVQIRQGPTTILAERKMLLGFRSMEWREDGALLVNGRPVSIKATEWTPIDPFRPDPKKALNDCFLSLIRAKLNAVWLRTASGFESEQFYSLCDQSGILVLQEVPVGSSRLDQHRVMNLEKHPSMAAWTAYGAGSGELSVSLDSLRGLDHARPIVPVSPVGEGHGLSVVQVPAAPHPQTWEDLLEGSERWPPPSSWRPDETPAQELAARIPEWGTVENYVDYSLATQSIQAMSLQAAIEQTRITAPNRGGLIAGQLRALWPGLSPALFDVLNRPSVGFWAVRRSWGPALLCLRRTGERFEAWIANASPQPVSGELAVFDALRLLRDRRSVARVTVPSGTAALVWSSTEESWAEKAFRENDLRIVGAFLGEPLSTVELTRAALPTLHRTDGTRIAGPASERRRDPRLPPVLQACLFCVAPAQVALPTADLHIITFAEDHGPWRITIRSFGRRYLRQVRLGFDPPDVARSSDQFFDVVPGSGRLVTVESLDPRREAVPVIVSAANAAPVSFLLLTK